VQDFKGFASSLLSHLSESIPVIYAAFYVADESHKRFLRAGTFAIGEEGSPREFGLGEGLAGQAALEKRQLEVSAGEIVQISAGMGTVKPGKLLFLPVINQDYVAAVIELAPVSSLNERQRALLDALLPSIALSAEILSGNLETRKLLARLPALKLNRWPLLNARSPPARKNLKPSTRRSRHRTWNLEEPKRWRKRPPGLKLISPI
jgi:two-component system chemotaxis sensor kinase CheA